MVKKHQNIARIENRFIFNAQYKLTAREQKVILFLISNIDPKRQERLHEQIVAVRDLERVLKADGKKWGGMYKEMQDFTNRILEKKIQFPGDLKIDGKRFPGKVNWFQSVTPVRNTLGEVSLRFLFSEDLKPFLIQLNEYAQINRLEAAHMKSGHAIRMFQVFRAQRDRMRRHEKTSFLSYELKELKAILGIADKYPRFNSFRERVLDTITAEINRHTSIQLLKTEYIKNSKRQVVKMIFHFTEKEKKVYATKKKGSRIPTEQELMTTFTKSQIRAYRLLEKRLIMPGIAFKKIVPKITRSSSEFVGFEDWYVEIAWDIFEWKNNINTSGSNEIKAGTFVNWLLKNEIFGQGDMFGLIQERINRRKKETARNDPQHWEQRLAVKGTIARQVEA